MPEYQRREQTFPKLSPALVAVVEQHGERRELARDEVVFDVGDRHPDFMVVVRGRLAIEQPHDDAPPELITVHEEHEFTGEVVMFSDRQSLVRGRALEPSEVIRVPHAQFQRMVGANAELSEILMRAFILRRVGLIERQQSDVTLVGSSHSADTLRLRSFLSRNGHPHRYLDIERDVAADAMLERFAITAKDIPIVACGGHLLRNPSNREIADCLGMSSLLGPDEVVDVAVIGAGPAGLAAAVYGASEGLHVVVIEGDAPGGQAGTSSKIENYLGFPTGISGQALAGRALTQAEKFGARMLVPRRATGLTCCQPYRVALDDGTSLLARSIVIASGARYRKLDVPDYARFEGRGIYYGATPLEARMCGGDEIVVVGGGNSAGQAAVFLAQHARHVHILVRREGLAATMSRYLIDRIESSDRISLHTHAEVIGLAGDESLTHQRWRVGDREVEHPFGHLFVMIGAAPNSEWLQGCVQLDRHGFVCTGALADRDWPLERPRHLLETNRPRIFAVGDIRADSVKRVASAVGEGSMCIRFVHEVLDDAH